MPPGTAPTQQWTGTRPHLAITYRSGCCGSCPSPVATCCLPAGARRGLGVVCEAPRRRTRHATSPHTRLGFLAMHAFRAARVVVDIGLHTSRQLPDGSAWTPESAVRPAGMARRTRRGARPAGLVVRPEAMARRRVGARRARPARPRARARDRRKRLSQSTRSSAALVKWSVGSAQNTPGDA